MEALYYIFLSVVFAMIVSDYLLQILAGSSSSSLLVPSKRLPIIELCGLLCTLALILAEIFWHRSWTVRVEFLWAMFAILLALRVRSLYLYANRTRWASRKQMIVVGARHGLLLFLPIAMVFGSAHDSVRIGRNSPVARSSLFERDALAKIVRERLLEIEKEIQQASEDSYFQSPESSIEAHTRTIMRLDGTLAAVHFLRGKLRFQSSRYDAAKSDLQKVVNVIPNDEAYALLYLSMIHLDEQAAADLILDQCLSQHVDVSTSMDMLRVLRYTNDIALEFVANLKDRADKALVLYWLGEREVAFERWDDAKCYADMLADERQADPREVSSLKAKIVAKQQAEEGVQGD